MHTSVMFLLLHCLHAVIDAAKCNLDGD